MFKTGEKEKVGLKLLDEKMLQSLEKDVNYLPLWKVEFKSDE